MATYCCRDGALRRCPSSRNGGGGPADRTTRVKKRHILRQQSTAGACPANLQLMVAYTSCPGFTDCSRVLQKACRPLPLWPLPLCHAMATELRALAVHMAAVSCHPPTPAVPWPRLSSHGAMTAPAGRRLRCSQIVSCCRLAADWHKAHTSMLYATGRHHCRPPRLSPQCPPAGGPNKNGAN